MSKAAADGYTLLIASPSSVSVNPSLNPKLSYMKDLVPVARLTSSPLVLAVNPGAGIHSLQELIATAKKKPGTLNYTSSGNGSAPHLGAAHFSAVTGVEMVHIPYKGGAPAIAGGRRRRRAAHLRHAAVGAADGAGRPPQGAGRDHAGRHAAGAERARHRRGRACRTTASSFWYGLFVPPARRPRS